MGYFTFLFCSYIRLLVLESGLHTPPNFCWSLRGSSPYYIYKYVNCLDTEKLIVRDPSYLRICFKGNVVVNDIF